MKKLALILTLLASCSAWAQGDAEAGKAKAATCAACHGTDGNSLLTQYPKLAGQHAGYLEKQIKEFKLGMTSGGNKVVWILSWGEWQCHCLIRMLRI